MAILPVDFYLDQDTTTVAQKLLGKVLLRESAAGLTAGAIVETEAYLAKGDPASHSAHGPTKRNQAMFGPAGSCYIYLSYGLHYCLNAVCQPRGVGEAVLIRALQPLSGAELMRQRRGGVPDRLLANGPGKVCQAMCIDLSWNGHQLQQAPLYILDGEWPGPVSATPRIGISRGSDLLLRFLAHPETKDK